MQPALERVAGQQQQGSKGNTDDDDSPVPDAAGDAGAGREPCAGGAGQPVHLQLMLARTITPAPRKPMPVRMP